MELLTSEFVLRGEAGQVHAERRWLFISYRKREHFIFLTGATTMCFSEEVLFCILQNKGSFFAVACQAARARYSNPAQLLPSEIPPPHRASFFSHLL